MEKEKNNWLRAELVAPWWEIAGVLAVMLGVFAYSSAHYALQNRSTDYLTLMLTNPKFIRLIAMEAFLLTLMLGYLRWRGWTPADFRIRPSWRGTLEAPVLAIGTYLVNAVTVAVLTFLVLELTPHPHGLLAAFITHAPHLRPHSIDIWWFVIVFGSVLNAFLEELVFMGYGFNQFAAKRGPLFALAVMVLLRMLLHAYQGPIHMLGIAAFSIFFGLAYWYLRRLWPLIMAHALVDIVSFSLLKILFGR